MKDSKYRIWELRLDVNETVTNYEGVILQNLTSLPIKLLIKTPITPGLPEQKNTKGLPNNEQPKK